MQYVMCKASLLVSTLLLSACAVKPVAVQPVEQTIAQDTAPAKVVNKTTYTSQPYTPKLWSGHKVLTLSAEQCAVKGKAVLETMQFGSVVQNGNYVYGNYLQNRAAIKCVALDKGSFVYVAVAGQQKKAVEELRNEIVWQF
ncbi:hypothetical protein ORJ00_11505 [Rheinheimera baltica]|uniref:hypothetical protein n=1 Tax=Rheinheimera baltica TaxID=67576 RepID=UPI0003FAE25A|nr:hypothetical protein [Rheinheimera baltica]MDP5143371.1 hypothetical protein [Rheinheimera baltica]MDP5151208.1 hypothetical protein [Rheinheimera baltica]